MKTSPHAVTFELVITAKNPSAVGLELVKEILLVHGVALSEIVETNERPYHHLSVFFRSELKAQSFKKKLAGLKIKRVSIKIKKLFKKDWFSKWKTEFKPFNLTKKIRVVPAWDKARAHQGARVVLSLDTGFAFGSGMHPTTRFMASLIERAGGKFDSFLDVGTGSGLLALVALVHGASDLKAFDISPDAVKAANANFQRNGFAGIKARKADIGTYQDHQKFDFVAANLITQDLIQLKRRLIKFVKKGQYLAVSGISANNLAIFKKAFKTLPLRCLKVERGQGWSALLYKRL